MAIETQEVHWSGRYISPDSEDPGTDPDISPLEGSISFSPVWDERISGFLSDATMAIHVRTFSFPLRQGRLMSQDGDQWVPGVQLPSRVGGVTLSWVAKFDIRAQRSPIPVRDVNFQSNPGGVISLVDMVPADAVYPRFSPDVTRGDSVEDVTVVGKYLVFTVGTGGRAKQKQVRLPWPDTEDMDARYLRAPDSPAHGQIPRWDATTGRWIAADPPAGGDGGIAIDTDGVPYYTLGGAIQIDTDGTPYF